MDEGTGVYQCPIDACPRTSIATEQDLEWHLRMDHTEAERSGLLLDVLEGVQRLAEHLVGHPEEYSPAETNRLLAILTNAERGRG